MAKSTKKDYRSFRGRKNDGGLVKPVNQMDKSELDEYFQNKYLPHITSSSLIFSISGEDGSVDYEMTDDFKKNTSLLIDHYKTIADYTEENISEKSIYKLDGWDLVRSEIDMETNEEFDTTSLENILSDNTYNSTYLGNNDLNWNLFYDDVYDKYFIVTHIHLGGDPRGNYSKALILEGEDKDDLMERFSSNFIFGYASLSIEFDDDSNIVYDSQNEFRNFLFEEVTYQSNLYSGSIAKEFSEDIDMLTDSDAEEILIDLVKHSNAKMKMGGETYSVDSDEPVLIVSINGKNHEFNISDYSDGEDLIQAIEDKANNKDYEYVSLKGFASEKFSPILAESDFDEIIEGYELYENSDFPLEVIQEYMSDTNSDNYVDSINEMENKYFGAYDNIEEFAEQLVEDGVYTPKVSELYITDTDIRLISIDEAEAYVEDLSFDDALELSGLSDDFEERKTEIEDTISILNDRKETLEENLEDQSGEDYDLMLDTLQEIEVEIEEAEDELDNLPDEFDDRVREEAREKQYDVVKNRLENDLESWLDEYGYTENLNNVSFLNIDYGQIANDLMTDFMNFSFDKEYVFNYEKGGKVEVGKQKEFPFYVMEMTSKRLVSGHQTKKEADEERKKLAEENKRLRFSVYPLESIKNKYQIDHKDPKNFLNFKDVSKIGRVALKKRTVFPKSIDHQKVSDALHSDLKTFKKKVSEMTYDELQELRKQRKKLMSDLNKNKGDHYNQLGGFLVRGGDVDHQRKMDTYYAIKGFSDKAKHLKKKLRENNLRDSEGEKQLMSGGQVSQLVYVDGNKLGRIKKVIRKGDKEKYVLSSPDGRKRMGRYSSDRITMAEEGIEIPKSEGSDVTLDEFSELIQGRKEDVLKAREIWSNWDESDRNAFYHYYFDLSTDMGMDFDDEEVTFESAKDTVNYLLFEQDFKRGGSVYNSDKTSFKTKMINDGAKLHKKNTHFAIHKPTNSIVEAWDYSDVDKEELRDFKDDYFFEDLKELVEPMVNKYKKSDFKIVEKEKLKNHNIILDNYLSFQGEKFAKGGAVDHGLKRGDTIVDDLFWEDSVVVENKGKKAKVNLEEGRRDEFKKGGSAKDDNWIQDAVEKMEKDGTEGAFTKQAEKHNMTPVEFAKKVLSEPNEFDETTRKRAQFVKNVNPELFDKGGDLYFLNKVEELKNRGDVDTYYVKGKYNNGDDYFESGFDSINDALDETSEMVELEEESLKYFVRFNDGTEQEIKIK